MDERLIEEARARIEARRAFLRGAAAGTVVTVLGGLYAVLGELEQAEAAKEKRPDGRLRVPPGQRVVSKLKPMGGRAGSGRTSKWRLKVHGEVGEPLEIGFKDLLALPQTTSKLDVHCVTRWSVLGAKWKGVPVKALVERAKVKPSARYVIFEAAHGYTANMPIEEALAAENLIAHQLEERPLPRKHGAPVRAVVPDLYFWKSPKWITGIRFSKKDEKGYWERRGYHNHADPWKEERHA